MTDGKLGRITETYRFWPCDTFSLHPRPDARVKSAWTVSFLEDLSSNALAAFKHVDNQVPPTALEASTGIEPVYT
ncbi:MAG: hypothetical protein AAFV87_16290, partial [Pseudomonadota bacterium]